MPFVCVTRFSGSAALKMNSLVERNPHTHCFILTTLFFLDIWLCILEGHCFPELAAAFWHMSHTHCISNCLFVVSSQCPSVFRSLFLTSSAAQLCLPQSSSAVTTAPQQTSKMFWSPGGTSPSVRTLCWITIPQVRNNPHTKRERNTARPVYSHCKPLSPDFSLNCTVSIKQRRQLKQVLTINLATINSWLMMIKINTVSASGKHLCSLQVKDKASSPQAIRMVNSVL